VSERFIQLPKSHAVEELLFFHSNRNLYEFNGDHSFVDIFVARTLHLIVNKITAFKLQSLQVTLIRRKDSASIDCDIEFQSITSKPKTISP
jgi:hypothetical protein